VPAFAVRNNYFALFVPDEIEATRRLTISLGLRWDYEQPRTERYDRFANFDWTARSPSAA
jgi:outer membrane receptor for ferrienterochelin and colicin